MTAEPAGVLEAADTLVVSDLHLGAANGADLLRRDGLARRRLLERLSTVHRLVVSGDLLELRHGPAALILDRAREALAALGAALGPDGELVVLTGNHDHVVLRPWIAERRLAGEPLGVAALIDPDRASPLTRAIGEAVGGARGPRLRFAYPGAWLSPPGGDGGPSVFVTHGHYQDAVWRMPTVERLIAVGVARAHGVDHADLRTPEQFEALLAPAYGWLDGMAEYARGTAAASSQRTSAGVWHQLTAGRGPRARALRVAVPLAVRALARAGLGDLEHRLGHETLRISGLRGMARMLAALGIEADHAIVGHLHRAGPLPGDAAWEWRLEHGGRLWNSGSWVHSGPLLHGHGPGTPYWPGRAVHVPAGGAPALEGLLDDVDDPWG